MITCELENGAKTSFRHVVLHAIVEKDGCLLLEKRAQHIPEGGKWGLPGGFLDRDETVEQGILRELKEETGWDGEVIVLFRINSNPNRPKEENRQNVALEFIVKVKEKTGEPDKESKEIRWFPIKDLPDFEEFAFDHSQTIKLYLQYKENQFSLPIVV
ncbi:NUDIX hydrolase [Candidatus Parcubacteria bacterium]|nr:MAG: NUDIX hydrolase [Candidatus Parcubacteria bacterium]